MGCFPALKGRKRRSEQPVHIKKFDPEEPSPIALPEPPIPTRSLQSAPPSFRTRIKPVQPITIKRNNATNNRSRALSAPSSIHGAAAEQEDLVLVINHEEQENSRVPFGSGKEQQPRPSSSQPLPLPSPRSNSVLKNLGSFKSINSSGPLTASGPLPLPPSSWTVRNFSYEEVAAACNSFSSDRCTSEGLSSAMYMASFGDETSNSKTFDATVVHLHASSQGLREFVNEVNTLAALQHSNLCKLLGYHARDGSDRRVLVFERLVHGSLDRLLYGRSDGPPLDWNTRMKIALSAAQGLTFLHEEGPFQAMYNEFSTASIQIDKDFSAKLSGYGCVGNTPEVEISNGSIALANLSVETLEKGLLTPKSNVWSFGVVLLELLTGRKNMNARYPKEERNLIKWTRPFLTDDCRLSLVMDPQLKGRFPAKAARTVSDIAQRCLQTDPSERPTMRTIVENLKIIQDMKYSCRFPLQDPTVMAGKHISRSPSLNGIIMAVSRSSFSPSPPSRALSFVSPLKLSHAPPLVLPPRACSSGFTLEEFDREEVRRSSSSSVRRSSVEGF